MFRAIPFAFLVVFITSCYSDPKLDNYYSTQNCYPGSPPSGPLEENPFESVTDKPQSTFSVDVDTASYTNARAYLRTGNKPPRSEIRTEEFLNYFDYTYAEPEGLAPIGVQTEVSATPWNLEHRLVRIGLKARSMNPVEVPPLNLVFLIDVSGSMDGEGRLPLVKSALRLLVSQLRPQDQIGIVTYSFDIRVALEATSGDKKDKILNTIDSLVAGGGTNGGAGIQTAYQMAFAHFIPNGINRVILSTDGDFNIGIVNTTELKNYVQAQAKEGIYLTVHGYGMGNFKDSCLETLADNGNGNYAFIDYLGEADKVFRMQLLGTLAVVAKDVKLRISFNEDIVESYRLIGYENRLMTGEEFTNDQTDAGDMGSGHRVTALYELITKAQCGRVLDLEIHYKVPETNVGNGLQSSAYDHGTALETATPDFRFAAAAAAFAMKLGDSQYVGNFTYDDITNLAQSGLGPDPMGIRNEFIELVKSASAPSN